MQNYKLLKVLGDGTFGVVTLAKVHETGEMVAIKKMKQEFRSWEECLKLREVQSLTKLKHPNIVRVKEIFRESNTLYFVFEYMKQNLYELIKSRNRPYPEHTVRNIIYQILQALAYMHRSGYFHRDLKPENVLCQGPELVKLADFGQAREIRSRPPYTDYVSTRWYRAPEVQLGSTSYNSPIDLWAVSCIMAEVYSGRPLFPGTGTIDQVFKICSVLGPPTKSTWSEGLRLANAMKIRFPVIVPTPLSSLVPQASDDGVNVMRDMLQWEPRKRPTATQVLKHNFFQINANLKTSPQHVASPLIRGAAPSKSKAQYPTYNMATTTGTDEVAKPHYNTATTTAAALRHPLVKQHTNNSKTDIQAYKDERQSSSQDSGVHMDNDIHRGKPSTIVTLDNDIGRGKPSTIAPLDNDIGRGKPSTIVPLDNDIGRGKPSTIAPLDNDSHRGKPSTIAPLPQITPTHNETLSKRRSEHNKSNPMGVANMFDNTTLQEGGARRRQWGEGKKGFMNRSKEEQPETRSPLGLSNNQTPARRAGLLQGVSKGDVAQYYFGISRYSPLTSSNKKSSESRNKVGFGSSAPRFGISDNSTGLRMSDNSTGLRINDNPTNFHHQSQGSKFMPSTIGNQGSLPKQQQQTQRRTLLPSWLKGNSRSDSNDESRPTERNHTSKPVLTTERNNGGVFGGDLLIGGEVREGGGAVRRQDWTNRYNSFSRSNQ